MWSTDLIVKQIERLSDEFMISIDNEIYGPLEVTYFTGQLYRQKFIFVNVNGTEKLFQLTYDEIYKYFNNNVIDAITGLLNIFFEDLILWIKIEESERNDFQNKYINQFKQFLKK